MKFQHAPRVVQSGIQSDVRIVLFQPGAHLHCPAPRISVGNRLIDDFHLQIRHLPQSTI